MENVSELLGNRHFMESFQKNRSQILCDSSEERPLRYLKLRIQILPSSYWEVLVHFQSISDSFIEAMESLTAFVSLLEESTNSSPGSLPQSQANAVDASASYISFIKAKFKNKVTR